jgi:hypothetical protein
MRIRNLIDENCARKILVALIFVTVAALIAGAPHLNYVLSISNASAPS